MWLLEHIYITSDRSYIITSLLGIYMNKEDAIEKAKGVDFLMKYETKYIFLLDTKQYISNKLATGPIHLDDNGGVLNDGYRTIREANYGQTMNLLSQIQGTYVNVITNLTELKQQLFNSIFTTDKKDVKLIKLALLNKDLYHEVESNKLCPSEKECNIDSTSLGSGSTALIISCAHDNIKNVETLLKNGAYVDFIDNNRMKSLAVAALNNNLEIVTLLLKYKPDIKTECYNNWPAKMFSTDPEIQKLLSF